MRVEAKHQKFVEVYFRNGFNKTRAYMEVYGCSYESARSAAPRLMKRSKFAQMYFEELQNEYRESRKKKIEDRNKLLVASIFRNVRKT